MSDIFNELLSSLDSLNLTSDQIRQLQSRLAEIGSGQEKAEGNQQLTVENGQIISCPKCGSVNIKKHDKPRGKQRYRCKDCGKTFMPSANTLFRNSRLSAEQWKGILQGIVLNLSLSQMADNIGTSIKTVWYNKQKVMFLLSEMFGKQDKFKDIAECDECFVHLSFKGKKDPRFFIDKLGRMPRHHRSTSGKIEYLQKAGLWDELQADPERLELLLYGDKYLPGTYRDNVCILTGKDRSNNIYLNPICLGHMDSSHVIQHFKGRFEPDAIIVTDSNNSYNRFAEQEKIHHEQLLSELHIKGPYSLARINSLHSNLRAYWPVARENLPSTKYLDLNLMLFWWIEKNKGLGIQQQIEALYAYLADYRGQFITYEQLKIRPLALDTKGIIPTVV